MARNTVLLGSFIISGVVGLAFANAANNPRASLDYVKVTSASDGPCTAIVKREGPLFSFEVFGLEPGESFPVSSISAGERIDFAATASKNGYYLVILVPNVKGRSSGIARVEFESRRCRIRVSFPWRDP